MTDQDRRAFLIRTGSVLSGLPLLRLAPGVIPPATTCQESADILAVGDAILPTELGPAGRERVSQEFQVWLEGFPDRVQLTPGWGSAAIRHGPSHPGPRWTTQLVELEENARRIYQRSFRDLPKEQQKTLIRSAISGGDLQVGGAPAEAEHVAIGLLAFFFRSPEATNLCYRAEIHREACRPLETAGEKPAPLGRGG